LLDSLPYWTWTATADGRVDYFSPQAASFTGVAGDQLLGSGWMQRVHPDDRDEVARVWNDAFDGVSKTSEPVVRWAGRAQRDGVRQAVFRGYCIALVLYRTSAILDLWRPSYTETSSGTTPRHSRRGKAPRQLRASRRGPLGPLLARPRRPGRPKPHLHSRRSPTHGRPLRHHLRWLRRTNAHHQRKKGRLP